MIGLEVFAAGSLWLASANPAQTRPAWCAPDRAPKVAIRPVTDPVKFDYGTSNEKLTATKTDTINPYGQDAQTITEGLHEGTVEIRGKTAYRTLEYQGQICAFFDSIEVIVHLRPKIYIAREHKRGGCTYNAIMQHELIHEKVSRQVANEYSQRAGQDIVAYLRKYPVYGPFPTAQGKVVFGQMNNVISTIVGNVNSAMSADLRQRQQAVDSLEEYERVGKIVRTCRD